MDIQTRVNELDLSRVAAKLQKNPAWTANRTQKTEREYRRFLRLIGENPGAIIVPWSQDLDDFWHGHIQDTRRYTADCHELFGRFIHHDPHIEQNPDAHHEAWNNTKALYAAAFTPTPSAIAAQRKRRKDEDNDSWWDSLTDSVSDLIDGFFDLFSSSGSSSPSHCGGSHVSGDCGHGHGCGGHGDAGGHSCGAASCSSGGCGGGGCGGGCGGN